MILAVVGGFVLRDAIKTYRSGKTDEKETVGKLAKWVQSINIPYTMMYFKSLNARISVLFTIPLGFATGMLAATIAVGGFIGVPSMIYALGVPSIMASATELVVAFVMGMGGTFKFALSGLVDIRLAMLILGGSLFGIQLGAMGTTYVKPFMIKLVMGTIMVIVLVSRGLMVPVYMSKLGLVSTLSEGTVAVLKTSSFSIMVAALFIGAFIILKAIWQGRRAESLQLAAEAVAHGKV